MEPVALRILLDHLAEELGVLTLAHESHPQNITLRSAVGLMTALIEILTDEYRLLTRS